MHCDTYNPPHRLVPRFFGFKSVRAMSALALHDAASNGDAEGTLHLLEGRADPNAVPSTCDSTPLEVAALEGHEAVVRHLLLHGAMPSAADADGWTPLHNALLVASTAGLGIVHALIEAHADVGATTVTDGHSPLHLAHNADPKLDWKLVNGADHVGRTAYYLPAIVQTMVAARADVNARSVTARTPLHEAASNGANSCALALLHNGADPTARDDKGHTPYELVTSAGASLRETRERLFDMLTPHVDHTGDASASSMGADEPSSSAATMPVDENSDNDAADELATDASWAAALEQLQVRLRGLRSSSSTAGEETVTPPVHPAPSRQKRAAPATSKLQRHKSSRGLT